MTNQVKYLGHASFGIENKLLSYGKYSNETDKPNTENFTLNDVALFRSETNTHFGLKLKSIKGEPKIVKWLQISNDIFDYVLNKSIK